MAKNVEQLSVEQAQRYWAQVARNLKQMIGQIEATTPETADLSEMVDGLREAATVHLIGANALLGHYTLLMSERGARQGQPQAPASYLPASRQAATPSYTAAHGEPARTW